MKIAIAVSDLGGSQLNSLLIPQINSIVKENLYNIHVFYEDLSKPCMPINFSSSLIHDSYLYNGIILATNISTARKAMKMASCKPFFYVWDLEWLRMKNKPFNYLYSTYNTVPSIARTEKHSNILKSNWNSNVIGICQFANLKTLINYVNN